MKTTGNAQELLSRARSSPGVEQVGVLGGEHSATVAVEVVATLEDIYVAFSALGVDTARLLMILHAFDLQARFSNWELVAQFPTRSLRVTEGEICYRLLRD
jgi:hypothetical protein